MIAISAEAVVCASTVPRFTFAQLASAVIALDRTMFEALAQRRRRRADNEDNARCNSINPKAQPDDNVAWGSDIAAQMLRRFGFPYISLCPGASYRGLHDSIINHLGNETPSMIVCLHEDHSVAIAHGYAKATGEPMACVLHANIGLLHGMMALYNAWCDRVPMFVLGATGPMDSVATAPLDRLDPHIRRPGRHDPRLREVGQSADLAGGDDRSDVPRQHRDAHRADGAGLYLSRCRPAGSLADERSGIPGHGRGSSRRRRRARRRNRSARAVALLRSAQQAADPGGRGDLSMDSWNARVKLAERLGACVMTDLRNHAVFPTDHPAHVVAPFGHRKMDAAARQIIYEADVILSLEWWDLGTVDQQREGLAGDEGEGHQRHARSDPPQRRAYELHAARPGGRADRGTRAIRSSPICWRRLGPGNREPWREKALPKPYKEGTKPTMVSIARELRAAVRRSRHWSAFRSLCRAWPSDIWPFHNPLAYLGRDGGGGLGSGPGIAVGAALGAAYAGQI